MEITIKRTVTNHLYTEGELLINGKKQTYTLEATAVMLKAGEYQLKVVKQSERKQYIGIFAKGKNKAICAIAVAHSWIDARRENKILIGEPLIPGITYKSAEVFARINDRMTKGSKRKEVFILRITEEKMKHNIPIRHWRKI